MSEAMYKDSFSKSFTVEMPFLQSFRERDENASREMLPTLRLNLKVTCWRPL